MTSTTMIKLRQSLQLIIGLLLPIFLISNSSSARILGNSNTQPQHNRHNTIQFLIRDVLNGSVASSQNPTTSGSAGNLPFSKPLGIFPPKGGIPIPQCTNPTLPSSTTSSSTQALDFYSTATALFFPTRATLQELELGTLTSIDEEIFHVERYGTQKLGRAQGFYVASSEEGSSHMMAITASMAHGEYKDGLRFFGVQKKDVSESHVAVIGGTGKYIGANGYATVKAVDTGGSNSSRTEDSRKLLMFNVYLT